MRGWRIKSTLIPPERTATTWASRLIRGRKPQPRQRGYDLSEQRARQFTSSKIVNALSYILVMDEANYQIIKPKCPKVQKFLSFAPDLGIEDVPDPYYSGAQGFETVLDMVEAASEGLLMHIWQEVKG